MTSTFAISVNYNPRFPADRHACYLFHTDNQHVVAFAFLVRFTMFTAASNLEVPNKQIKREHLLHIIHSWRSKREFIAYPEVLKIEAYAAPIHPYPCRSPISCWRTRSAARRRTRSVTATTWRSFGDSDVSWTSQSSGYPPMNVTSPTYALVDHRPSLWRVSDCRSHQGLNSVTARENWDPAHLAWAPTPHLQASTRPAIDESE